MEGAAGKNIKKNGGGGALRSDVAIRCAKAALLLYSLKSSPARRRDTAVDDDDDIAVRICVISNSLLRNFVLAITILIGILKFDDQEKEMKKEIGDLKVEVARERLRNKRIKIFGFLELLLLALLFAVSVFLFMLAFEAGAS
ncbi:hypothetical protein DVH24_042522 [Malus domestica]|uniref:Uncharacterized protein n=1 Tax=Malus domestica TaxID=3750 RepID=A0A498JAL3_MALDO|nr:hypothetical protein DVH24_042522 [Malus domestica]